MLPYNTACLVPAVFIIKLLLFLLAARCCCPPPRGSPLLPRSDHQQTHHVGVFRDTTMDLMNVMVRAQITLHVAGIWAPGTLYLRFWTRSELDY